MPPEISALLLMQWAISAWPLAILLAIWIALRIWGPVTIIRTIDGANGRNWPGLVVLDPHAGRPAAVWAQETYESQHKLNPINLALTRLSKRHRRSMEIMGHEIEVQVCARLYSQTAHDARMREAETMQRGYGGLFRIMTVPQIYEAMADRSADAIAWVDSNQDRIKKYRGLHSA